MTETRIKNRGRRNGQLYGVEILRLPWGMWHWNPATQRIYFFRLYAKSPNNDWVTEETTLEAVVRQICRYEGFDAKDLA